MSFGETLRTYRRAAGLTQEELAARAQLSGKAISALERGVNHAPRRETLLLLMKALRLSARDRTALQAAARLSALDGLHGDIVRARGEGLAADRSVVAGEDPLQSRLPTRKAPVYTSSHIVGRAAELALIDQHLHGSRPPILVFAGEPGIGKTRLLRETRERAVSRGYAVIEGGCHRRTGQAPYAPVSSALARCLTHLRSDELHTALQGCAWLSRLLPELVQDGLVDPPPQLLAEQEKRLIFRAVDQFLENVAGSRGTLLVLDDLQWASPDALDLLASIADGAESKRFQIVAACRTTERESQAYLWEIFAELAREDLAEIVELSPLATSEAEDFLRDVLPRDVRQEDMRSIVRRAGGVPFFLVSCAHMTSLPGGLKATSAGIPWTVAQSVRQRVAALPRDGACVLGGAAVIGRQVPLRLLASVCAKLDISTHAVSLVLDAACRDRLLLNSGPDAFQFAHDLIREAVEDDLGPSQRAAFHRWTAEERERVSIDSSPEILAYHYAQAGEHEKAVSYLEVVVERALGVRAYAEAARALSDLATHLDALGRPLEAAHARERQGESLTTAALYDEALVALERAASTYEECGEQDALARVLTKVGEAHALRVTSDEGIARLQAALRSFGDEGPSAHALAGLYIALAWLINTKGRYGEALPLAERGAELAKVSGDTALLVKANLRRGHLLLMLQRIGEGITIFREALPMVEAGEDLRSLRFALNNLGWIHEALGKFEIDKQFTDRALDAAIRLDDPSLLAYMRSNHGGPAYNRGEWEQACADFESGLALMRQVRPSWASAWPPLLLGQLRVAQGQHDEGTCLLAEAIACASQNTDLQALRWAHGTLAECELLRGEPQLAISRLEPLLDCPGEHVIDVTVLLPLLAWAYADVGLEEQAAATAESAVRRAESSELLPALANALRSRGMLWQRRGQASLARKDFAGALVLDRRMPYPYDEAKTLYRIGLLEESTGRRRQAHRALSAGLRILSQLGEQLYFERLEQAIARIARAWRYAEEDRFVARTRHDQFELTQP